MKRQFWIARFLVAALIAGTFAGRAVVAAEADEADGVMDPWALMAEPRYPAEIAREDVTSFVRWNGLSAKQRDAALRLHASYSERQAAAARKLVGYEDDLLGGDVLFRTSIRTDGAKLEAARVDYLRYTKGLKDELLAGARALLAPEQETARWWLDQRLAYLENISALWAPGRLETDLVRALEQVLPDEHVPDGIRAIVNMHVAEAASLVREAVELQREASMRRAELGALPTEEYRAAMIEIDAWQAPMARKASNETERALNRIKEALPDDLALRLECRLYMSAIRSDLDISTELLFRRVEQLGALTAEQRARIDESRTAYLKLAAKELKLRLDKLATEQAGYRMSAAEFAMVVVDVQREQVAHARNVAARMRDLLTPEQREAAGPPISVPRVLIPDFDSDDAPAPRLAAGQEWIVRIFASSTPGPDVTELDLCRLGRSAKLSAEQSAAADELHTRYAAKFADSARRYTEFLIQLSQSDSSGMPERDAHRLQISAMVKYDLHKSRLRDGLLSDIDALLTDEQKPSLALLRAASDRRRSSDGELLSAIPGAGVDLPMLVQSALRGGEPSDELAALLEQYERDMIPPSGQLLALSRSGVDAMLRSLDGDGDFESRFSAIDVESTRACEKPFKQSREISFEYFRLISPLMPEETRDEFDESFYRAASGWSGFDKRQSAHGLAEAIFQLSGLSRDQTTALNTALREHAKAMRGVSQAIYEELAAKTDQAENSEQRQAALEYSRNSMKPSKRREADKQLLDRLMAILTTEQQGRLPMPYRPAGQVTRPNFDEE